MSLEIIEDTQLNHSQPTIIKVIGVGGGGCNAVNRMIENEMRGVDFVAVNTDLQSLANSKAQHKIQIGQNLTKGLGAGSLPDIGRDSAEEQEAMLRDQLLGSNMVFITAGMGGGTGTGAAPVVARIAKELGALTVAVVTKPFLFENRKRMNYALTGIAELEKFVDTIIVVPNENLLHLTEELTINDTYKIADSVLMDGVKGISDLVVHSGHMNVDFADVQTVMKNQGSAVMCSTTVDSKLPITEILEELTNNPLVEQGSIDGAKGLLINVVHGNETPMTSASKLINAISAKADSESICINGFLEDETLGRDLKITLIATGFDFSSSKNTQEKKNYLASANSNNSNENIDTSNNFQYQSKEEDNSLSWKQSSQNFDSNETLKKVENPFNEKSYLEESLFGNNLNTENQQSTEEVQPEPIYTLSADPLNHPPLTEMKNRKATPVSVDESELLITPPFQQVNTNKINSDDLSVPTYIRSQKKITL